MQVPIADTTLAIDDDRIDGAITGKLDRYLAGERIVFNETVDLSDFTAFQKRVLGAIRGIGYGETVTYSEIAGFLTYAETHESFEYAELAQTPRDPDRARAAANACGANPVPIIIPCHRVVAADGIGGYSSGVQVKRALLDLEGCSI